MGLISAALGAAGGVLADQWKEYFYCEALPENVIVTKGKKRVSGRSSNTKGSDNIISNGSVIAVADGQCMIIVDQGKIAELCAEPGEFVYDTSTEPSIFSGSLGAGILETVFHWSEEGVGGLHVEITRDDDGQALLVQFGNLVGEQLHSFFLCLGADMVDMGIDKEEFTARCLILEDGPCGAAVTCAVPAAAGDIGSV